ncbi:tRNA guanosine(15) transglycosylase TgtA [Candidatus Bathyarchaeota archaeon]|nr:tRNA guanosine(15) transglycosylase TgtA [Candidatus Bathyarchaeota archaeon]
MSFEIRERDILAKIGKLETRRGKIETPTLLPVVSPLAQPISPEELWKKFGCQIIITNAYLIKKKFEKLALEKGVHKLLNFPGTIMTDSGAYQILVYGEVKTTPEEIAKFQEQIGTDIAVILDVPTGWQTNRRHAEWTVKETLRRAALTLKLRTREDIHWVGPIQGGNHLDLVAFSAKEVGQLPFSIYALGSPTQVMERYLFDVLVDMIATAKMNLPPEKPFHLFGAGHPFMFALAIALGCDMFDSAAYAIYARKNRYMTDYGTVKIDQLKYLPCHCPVCSRHDVADLKASPKSERERLLAEHNLYVSLAEIRRIKQAIVEGRLWELLELRARSHPSLLRALRKICNYAEYIEKHSPVTKKRGIFYFGSTGLCRPEVIRHQQRIQENYNPPEEAEILILLPQTSVKPFHNSPEYKKIMRTIAQTSGEKLHKIHMCTYAAPFGVVPLEIDDTYPLSQFEITWPPDLETIRYVAKQISEYLMAANYKIVIFHNDPKNWGNAILNASRRACKMRNIQFLISSNKLDPWSSKSLQALQNMLNLTLAEQE